MLYSMYCACFMVDQVPIPIIPIVVKCYYLFNFELTSSHNSTYLSRYRILFYYLACLYSVHLAQFSVFCKSFLDYAYLSVSLIKPQIQIYILFTEVLEPYALFFTEFPCNFHLVCVYIVRIDVNSVSRCRYWFPDTCSEKAEYGK